MLDERAKGTWRRLRIAPVRRSKLLVSKVFTTFLQALLVGLEALHLGPLLLAQPLTHASLQPLGQAVEAGLLPGHPVQIRCADRRMPETGQVAVAKIVGENEYNVGLGGRVDNTDGQCQDHGGNYEVF